MIWKKEIFFIKYVNAKLKREKEEKKRKRKGLILSE